MNHKMMNKTNPLQNVRTHSKESFHWMYGTPAKTDENILFNLMKKIVNSSLLG